MPDTTEVQATKPVETTDKAAATPEATSKPEGDASAGANDSEKPAEGAKDDAKDGADQPAKNSGGRDRHNGRGKFNHKGNGNRGARKYKENIKARYDHLPETDDPVEIRKQVEFYFSDSNLPMDNFLFSQVGGSENKPVPISTIHSFKRMRRFQPFSAVVAALKDSEILEVTENEEVRRKVPLATDAAEVNRDLIRTFADKAAPRSIYAKGFGEETETTQVEIEKFFEPHGPVRGVRLRRTYPTQKFKGSVFVEFDSEETQQKFLALDPKPQWNGADLLIMGKKEYVEMKAADIKAGKVKPSFRPSPQGKGRRGGDDWKSRREAFQRGGFRDNKRKRDGEDGGAAEEPKEKKPAVEGAVAAAKEETAGGAVEAAKAEATAEAKTD